jgi:protein-tyrosine phosphatase
VDGLVAARRDFQIANASFVTDQLLVGGDLDWDTRVAVLQLCELAEAGVTHIVDCRIEAEDARLVAEFAEVMEIELDYLHSGIDDVGQQVPADWFEALVDHVLAAIEAGGVVLTHCHMGINRGPSLGYAVMLAQGWDPVQALARIVEVRSIAYVAYAEDALVWHHGRRGSPPEQLESDLDRVAAWRRDNDVDLLGVLRLTRPGKPPG